MKKHFTLCSLVAAFLFFTQAQVLNAQQKWPEFTGVPTAVDKGSIAAGNVSVAEGDEVIITVQLDCANITQDLALFAGQEYGFMAPPADVLSFTPATFTAAEANADPTVNIKLKPSKLGSLTYAIYGGSEELEGVFFLLSVSVTPKTYTSLADYIADYPAGVTTEGLSFTTEGDFVVTHTWKHEEKVRAYIQDATAGVIVHTYEGITCQVGDHFKKVKGMLNCGLEGNGEGVYGLEGLEASPLIGTATKNEPAAPSPITLADLAQHHGRLVSISDVQFDETGAFTEADTVAATVGETKLHICLFPGSDLVGTNIPAEADLVCIVRTIEKGNIILSPRSKADVTSHDDATAVENVQAETPATKMIENGQLYIIRDGIRYNIFGTKQ